MTSEFQIEELEVQTPDLMTVFTLVIWMTCLVAGALGIWIPYPQARPPTAVATPVEAKLINVDVSQPQEISPPSEDAPLAAHDDSAPPPEAPQLPSAVAMPNEPALMPLANVLPAFVKPVETPIAVTATPVPTAAPKPSAPQPPTVRRITYGQGEGRQPPPAYPIEAQMGGEEGTVTIQMNVNEDGRITNAEVIVPCPWPLLNQAALRVVRDEWRFASGPKRIYQVSIRYQRR